MKKMTNPNTGLAAAASENISRALLWSRILKGGNRRSIRRRHRASRSCRWTIRFRYSPTRRPRSAGENARPAQRDGARAAAADRRRAGQPIPNQRRIMQRLAGFSPPALTSVSPSRDENRGRLSGARSRARSWRSNPRRKQRAPAEAAPPPAARRIAPDELAALLKRAKGLLAIGDITSARLLLERAADAQEAEAALMLAGDV